MRLRFYPLERVMQSRMVLNMLEIGFGKVDITPRVGVEMQGFGPYIHRRGLAVRDRLFARAIAGEARGQDHCHHQLRPYRG